MKNIEAKMFTSLFDKIEVEDMLTDGFIGFCASLGSYSISFYAIEADNFEIEVEDFGYMKGKDWVQCEPTETQLNKMQVYARKEANNLLAEQAYEEARAEEAKRDAAYMDAVGVYAYHGVSRSDFY